MHNKFNKLFGYFFLLCLFSSSSLYYFFGLYFKNFLIIHAVLTTLFLILFLFSGGINKIKVNNLEEKAENTFFYYRIIYSILVFSCVLFSFYIFKSRFYLEIDTTENKAYTLDSQTKNILKRQDLNIIARYFVRGSEILKTDIDLLQRYHAFKNSFFVTQHDLDKERPLADSLGITEINSLHLSMHGSDSSGVIVSGGLTEEKITNALSKLTRSIKPQIYFSTRHGEGDINNTSEVGFSLLKESLESDGFKTQEVEIANLGKLSAKGSAVIFLCPTRDLIEGELLQLQEYINNGGSLVLFVEPKTQTNLLNPLSKLGFNVGKDTIVGLEKFTSGNSTLGVQPIISQYADHPALKGFDKSIIVSAAVSVRKKADADQIRELAFSDADSWAETNLNELYSKTPIAKKEEGDLFGPVSIASLLDRPQKNLTQRIAVIGDLDFVANVNLYQLFNRDFVLNIINWVVGDEEYIDIRVGTLRKSKKTILEEEFSNIFIWTAVILPELILLFGIFNWQKRKWS